jgi:hypothetical protein
LKAGWVASYQGYKLKLEKYLDYLMTLGYDEISEYIKKNREGSSEVRVLIQKISAM